VVVVVVAVVLEVVVLCLLRSFGRTVFEIAIFDGGGVAVVVMVVEEVLDCVRRLSPPGYPLKTSIVLTFWSN
jgi:hypothetical protein